MKLSAIIDAMVATGASAEQIAAVVRAAEVADDLSKTEKRARDAERQRKFRASRMSRDVTPVTCDASDSPPPKEGSPTPPKEITPTLDLPPEEPVGSSDPKGAKTPSRRRRLPDDADLTAEMVADALKASLTEDEARSEFLAFCDHHRARGNAMADWRAAWRTWCGNAVKFAAGKNRGSPALFAASPSRNGQPHDPGRSGSLSEAFDRLKREIRSREAGDGDPEAGRDQRDYGSAPH